MQLRYNEQNPARGSIPCGYGETWDAFPAGQNNQLLVSMAQDGMAVPPGLQWRFLTLADIPTRVVAESAAYTATASDQTILATAGATGWALTLPLAASVPIGFELVAKQIDSGVGTVTLTASGSDKIDGAATYVINSQYMFVRLISDGSANWYVTGAGTA